MKSDEKFETEAKAAYIRLSEQDCWTSEEIAIGLTKWVRAYTLEEMDAPKCQTYEAECQELGKLCERLGIDCSNCYDKEDLSRLIIEELAEVRGKLERLKTSIKMVPVGSCHSVSHYDCDNDPVCNENCPVCNLVKELGEE